MVQLISYSVLFLYLTQTFWAYQIPKPRGRIYKKGFAIRIRHESGISKIAFSGSLNKDIRSNETDDFIGPASQCSKKQFWIYINYDAAIEWGDFLIFRISVIKNGKIYFAKFATVASSPYFGPILRLEPKIFERGDTSEYIVPRPSITVYRNGIEASIPDAGGMQYFYFCINFYVTSLSRRKTYSGIVRRRDKNGLWKFRVSGIKPSENGTIFYSMLVVRNNNIYIKTDGSASIPIKITSAQPPSTPRNNLADPNDHLSSLIEFVNSF
ncbi:hypothetical protein EVAR_73830_1 [Eumeta japonica]|uniref:CBM39 domain-containing protein n=1 Tax=Eumeta variegata TaxID=151549 RepID=A0A4C1SIE2_EUMVA|nr:hypothetical protein EVAR_73830_1 [Eumeta japonica]